MAVKIELVIADRGWILEKIAQAIQDQGPRGWEIRIVTEATDWPDLHYFIPYSKQPARKPTLSACFFTHRESVEPARSNFLQQAETTDYCVTMSSKYTHLLNDHGIENVHTIETGVDLDRFDIRLQIGVVGRTYHTGRKGEDLIDKCLDLDNIEFLFTGSGWLGPSVHLSDSELPEFFNKLDYLLIPSRIEGGPVPLMEALASGREVIAPSDVGFVNQFPHIPFENGSADSLREVLRGLVRQRQLLRDTVKDYSWERFGKRHIELFEGIAKENGVWTVPANDTGAAPEKIYFISHCGEGNYKGGPTTRMRLIAEHATEQGIQVETLLDAALLSGTDCANSVVHVFNSWPPESAANQVREAKAKGYLVVYSPIALNLEHIEHYTKIMPQIAAARSGANRGWGRAKKVPPTTQKLRSAADYRADPDLIPGEGVETHFHFLRESTNCADGNILLSRYEQDFLKRVGCNLGQCVLIENGVDSEEMATADPLLFKEKFKLDRYVLVVGRIEPRKNQATIAAALASSDLKLVLIGDCLVPKYLELVKRCGGQNVLHIQHCKNRELLASAYRGAAVFLMASWAEGAPLAALEAASAGTPLVLSSQSSEEEYFGADALYVSPADMDEIEEYVHLAAEEQASPNSEYRDTLSAKHKARFSARRHATQTLEFYSTLLSQRLASEVDGVSPDTTPTAADLRLTDVVAGLRGLKVKLHLGCGGMRWKDFINVDLYPEVDGIQDQSRSGCIADVFEDIRSLGLPPKSVDEIFCSHVVEHFVRWEASAMFHDWYRVLKIGGIMVIEMPSFWRCVAWLFHPSAKKRRMARSQFYGNQGDKLDFETHRYVWSPREIRTLLLKVGFREVRVTHRTKTHHPGRDMRVVAKK